MSSRKPHVSTVVIHAVVFAGLLHSICMIYERRAEHFSGAASPYSTGYIVGECILIVSVALVFAILTGGGMAGAGAGVYVATQ